MPRNKTLYLYNGTKTEQEWTIYAEGVINETYKVGQTRKTFTISLSKNATIQFGVDDRVYLRANYQYSNDTWTSHTDTPNEITFSVSQSAVTVSSNYTPETKSTLSTMLLCELDQMIDAGPYAALDAVLADDKQSAFQDSDGLISFVNMSSSLVTNNKEYTTGREVCDKISNFFATLRIKVFSYLQKNPNKVLTGDSVPQTQWDAAVTHYMQFLLAQAGGLTNYKVVTETYSVTQVIAEFSTDLIKLLFDAAMVPEAIISDVIKFVQGVGASLRASWDDKSRNYATALLGQCHEAVPVDSSGNTVIYFPKIKYYFISVDSSQQAFTSNCAKVEKLTFNFKYEYYVTGLKASVLDNTSNDYKSFVKFLDKAQNISYKDANEQLDAILDNVTSDTPSTFKGTPDVNVFGVDLVSYPVVNIAPQKIEWILNRRAKET